jgi:replicative DNA helicase
MSVPYSTTPEDIKQTEAALLGNLLLSPEQGAFVQAHVQPEDFAEDRHRLIYEAFQAIPDTSTFDSIQAIKILLSEQEIEQIGGEAYLMMLKQQAESTTIPIADQVSLLKKASLHRMLRQVGESFQTQLTYDESNDLLQLLNKLEQAMVIVKQLLSPRQTPQHHVLPLQRDLEHYLADLDLRREQHMRIRGLSTGFADLDTVIGGLQRSDLIIIAGPPSIGKTSFALSIALHVLLEEKRSIGLFSLEAPQRQVIERLLSMEARLDQRLLRVLELDNDDRTRLEEASASLKEAQLWIDDTANLSTTHLQDKARLMVKQYGVELLIVDYVHLMLSSINDKRHENRVQEIGEISRSLKALARELNIPVLALAQLSRAFESRPIQQFQLSDLRDGSLENDADLVLFLSPADREMAGSTTASKLVTLHIAKHRNGPCADIDICFQPHAVRFHDLPTVEKPSIHEQPPSSISIPTNQPPRQFPNLKDLLEQSLQKNMKQVRLHDVSETAPQAIELSRESKLDEPNTFLGHSSDLRKFSDHE